MTLQQRLRENAKFHHYSGNTEEDLANAAFEAADELDRLGKELSATEEQVRALTITLGECARENAALRKDAERYRWLR